ncbi:MAG: restriction endonuclease subunit S [Eubacteriales bacterium]|nr:restriction endonuclease subunit S [Eubacteriales bacterium]
MRYKWGDLISLEYGKPVSDKAKINGKHPVFGTNGQIGTSDLPPLCKAPSFILGRKGAYRGVHFSAVPFSIIDTAFFALNLHPELLNIKWAYYKFLTYDINSMNSGSAIPSTDRYEIYSIELDLPDIEEQKRAVKIIEGFDSKISNIAKINDNLSPLLRETQKVA